MDTLAQMLATALVGGAVALSINSSALAPADVLRERTPGPRLSRVSVPRLGGLIPLGLTVALTVVSAGFAAAYLPLAVGLRPDVRGWVVATGVLALIGTVAGWVAALWLVRQPQLASSAEELAWSDTLRRRDVSALLVLGPGLTFGLAAAAYTSGDGPMNAPVQPLAGLAWAYAAVLVAFAVAWAVVERKPARR
ncbi:hypothetical protein [Mariniluteicoccus flavus]